MTQGNHEYRTSLLAGIDPLRYVAKSLGLIEKNRYTDNSYILTLLFGKRNGNKDRTNDYIIYGIHGGSGGGRRAGSTSNALEDMNRGNCKRRFISTFSYSLLCTFLMLYYYIILILKN